MVAGTSLPPTTTYTDDDNRGGASAVAANPTGAGVRVAEPISFGLRVASPFCRVPLSLPRPPPRPLPSRPRPPPRPRRRSRPPVVIPAASIPVVDTSYAFICCRIMSSLSLSCASAALPTSSVSIRISSGISDRASSCSTTAFTLARAFSSRIAEKNAASLVAMSRL